MKLFVLAGILALGVALPKDSKRDFHSAHPNIINGVEAEPHSFPYQVYVNNTNSVDPHKCQGTLISTNFVLTSGTCTSGVTKGTVVLGAHNITKYESTQQVIKAKRFIPHEKYDSIKIIYDIGLIELEEEVKENQYIKIATLPALSDAADDLEGVCARFSGWGSTSKNTNTTSPVLMFVDDIVMSNAECLKIHPNNVHDYNLCLKGTDGTGICFGDSGDPLSINGKIFGIASFHDSECRTGIPIGFTRVTSFLRWIGANSDVLSWTIPEFVLILLLILFLKWSCKKEIYKHGTAALMLAIITLLNKLFLR